MKRSIKWIAFALAFIMLIALGIESKPLGERAVIVGLAIDKAGEEYEVSAQIIIAGENDTKSSGSMISSVKAETISGALSRLSAETSMLVTMSHCNLIILGMDVIKTESYKVLDYLVRNAYLSENALVIASETTAKDVISCKTAHSEMSSFALQRSLMVYGEYDDTVKKTAREFLADYHTHNSANWLTLVKKKETQKPQTNTNSGGASEQGGEEKYYVFDLSETAIIRGESYVFTASREMTVGMNFATQKLSKGSIYVEGDKGEKIELYILSSKPRIRYDSDNLLATIELKLDLLVKEIIGEEDYDLSKVELSESETKRVSALVSRDVYAVFDECKARNVDVFDLYDGFYGRGRASWREKFGANYLPQSKIIVKTKIKYH